MKDLLEQLKKLRDELEKKSKEKNKQSKILDIEYYKPIKLMKEEQPLYLVEKEVDGNIKRELQVGDKVIANINDDNTIQMKEEFSHLLESGNILLELRDVMPISLNELEQIENSKLRGKQVDSKVKEKDQEKGKQKENSKDIEIDLDKKITETKTFSELVPEVKQKGIKKVKIRRLDMTRFEFYGINEVGQEVSIDSLKMTEGTNPYKKINEINKDGSKVEKDEVYSMFQIVNGTNEQRSDEGFTVDLEDETGIAEVGYYRRSRDNEYISIPVNLKNTNQKRTEKEVREFAEKRRNTQVSDNINRADNILEEQEETSLENIDDNMQNDNPETRKEYEEKLIKEAAKRCKMSVEGFTKILEQERKDSEPIEESIERAEDEVNEQVIGGERRR